MSDTHANAAVKAVYLLADAARASFHALDDAEEIDGKQYVIDSDAAQRMSDAFDALEPLAEDPPGEHLSPVGRALLAIERGWREPAFAVAVVPLRASNGTTFMVKLTNLEAAEAARGQGLSAMLDTFITPICRDSVDEANAEGRAWARFLGVGFTPYVPVAEDKAGEDKAGAAPAVPGASPPEYGGAVSWGHAQFLTNFDPVEQALIAFSQDATFDNGTALVQSVLQAAGYDTAASRIHEERLRQIIEEGHTLQADRENYVNNEMIKAAICYLRMNMGEIKTDVLFDWPWKGNWFKPTTPERNFEKAGALIIAAYQRHEGIKEEAEAIRKATF